MQKLKNLMNPGGKHDDEVMYGSGQSDDPVHSGTTGTTSGQGSHFDSSTTGAGENNPLGSDTNPTATTGSTGYDGDTSGTGTQLGSTGVGPSDTYGSGNTFSSSRMPGTFDNDVESTASIKSGVQGAAQSATGLTGTPDVNKPLPSEPGTGSTGLGSDTTTGTHESKLAEHLHGDRGVGSNAETGSGLPSSNLPDRSVDNSGLGNTSSSTGTSHLGRDAATGGGALAAAEEGHRHHDPERQGDYDNLGTSSGRSFPLGGSSNTTSDPTSTGYGSTDTTGNQGGGLGGSQTMSDPTATGYGSTGTTGSRLGGSDAASDPTATGYGNTGNSTSSSGLGSSNIAGYGSTGTTSGAGVGTGQSGLHTHPSGFPGDPCGPGETAPGVIHYHDGPHATETANALDPNVNAGETAIGSTTTGHHSHHGHHHGQHGDRSTETGVGATSTEFDSPRGDRHLGRDALAGGAVGGAGLGAYEESRRDQPTSTNAGSTGIGSGATGTGYGGQYDTNRGQHGVDEGTLGGTQTGSDTYPSSTAVGSQGYDGNNEPTTGGRDRHLGRDAGLAGTGGVVAYEADKHLGGRTDPTTQGTTSGYGGSSLDPGLDTTRSGITGATDNGKDHHLGRDAAGAGVLGTGAYEAEKHHHDREGPTRSTGTAGATTATDAGRDHHLGRDAAGAGVLGGGAYEAEKHHHNREDPTRSSGLSGTTPGDHRENLMGVGDSGVDKEFVDPKNVSVAPPSAITRELGGSGRQVAPDGELVDEPIHAGSTTHPSSGYGDRATTGHHHGERDAAIGAGAVGAGVAGAEFSKKDAEKEAKHEAKEHAKQEKALEKQEAKHEKALEKQEAKHEKALEKEHHHHEKKAEHEDKPEKKHGGILGFLHRDKPDKELKEDEAARKDAGPAEAVAGVGAAGLTEHEIREHEKNKHERNRLHKDPPASIAQAGNTTYGSEPQGGYASPATGVTGTGTTALAEGDQLGTGTGGYSDLNQGYGNEPQSEYAPQVTGGTGTTALAGERGSNTLNEPHTGLPMDRSKGDGNYGTDNTPIGSQDAELARSDGYGSSTTGATDSRTDGVTGAREHESPVAKMLHGDRGVGSNTLE